MKKGKRSGKSSRQQIVLDSSDSDSDLENGVQMSIGRSNAPSSGNSHRQAHASNVIMIDCDDGYAIGPAMAIERNLAAAPVCTAEDNAAVKISVRINGVVESYDLRRVSDEHKSNWLSKLPKFNPVNSCHSLSFKNSRSWPHKLPTKSRWLLNT